jgi:predicted membrane protein
MLIVASVGAGITGGPFAVPGGLAGILAAVLAYRLDRKKALV